MAVTTGVRTVNKLSTWLERLKKCTSFATVALVRNEATHSLSPHDFEEFDDRAYEKALSVSRTKA